MDVHEEGFRLGTCSSGSCDAFGCGNGRSSRRGRMPVGPTLCAGLVAAVGVLVVSRSLVTGHLGAGDMTSYWGMIVDVSRLHMDLWMSSDHVCVKSAAWLAPNEFWIAQTCFSC